MTALPASALVNRGHDIGWVTAAPLWPELLSGTPDAARLAGMHRPAVLRLETDDFMAELTALLAAKPADLSGLVATPRTYRLGPPGAATARQLGHIKLYQPVHGQFNLVAATLVCRVPGLPDRTVDPASADEVGFVLRRMSGQKESAWTTGGWIELDAAGALAPAEQMFPMFPMPYVNGGRRRRLFVGLIPTASAASVKGGGSSPLAATGPAAGVPADGRLDELETKVCRPLRQMTGRVKPGEDPGDRDAFLRLSAAQRREASRFVLLDFADLLARYAVQLWAAVSARQLPAPGAQRTAYELLRDQFADPVSGLSWLDAVRAVWAEREAVWGETGNAATTAVDLSRTTIDPEMLQTRLSQAWPATPPPVVPDFPAPKLDPLPATRYVLRCAYRRPHCRPVRPDVVSAPSVPFAIASFFDLDAPARPVQIVLPVDTSIAGLRKAPRNVSVLISRELRQQMERVMDAKKLLKGEIDSPGSVDVGLICSFSLPIITICALILLMIFVFLLNIVFWWVPFFRICFPLQLKASN